jgi:hypothetical protein
MLLGRDSGRSLLDHLSLLRAEKILEDLDAALGALGDC